MCSREARGRQGGVQISEHGLSSAVREAHVCSTQALSLQVTWPAVLTRAVWPNLSFLTPAVVFVSSHPSCSRCSLPARFPPLGPTCQALLCILNCTVFCLPVFWDWPPPCPLLLELWNSLFCHPWFPRPISTPHLYSQPHFPVHTSQRCVLPFPVPVWLFLQDRFPEVELQSDDACILNLDAQCQRALLKGISISIPTSSGLKGLIAFCLPHPG